MCPGIRPATGWIANFTSMPRLVSCIVDFADAVLRLRDRHPVAGNDDDLARRCSSRSAASCGVPLLTAFASAALPPACTCPNAPKSTLVNDRFIARHMITDRIRPDDPSSAPAVMSTLFSSTKPIATADSPAYAFSSEMTVGMSAPPIGMISSTPKTSDSTMMTGKSCQQLGPDDEHDARDHGDREQRRG